jgi:uncharacterized protein YndB with AHSA1/START domain
LPSSAHGSGPEDQFTLLEAAHGYADTVPLEGFREIHHLVSVPSLIRPERLGRATLAGSEMWATASIKRRVITVQPDELALRLKRVVQASPFTVFRACTVPEELAKWWGPRGFATPAIEIDLRVGGRYRFGMQPPEGDLFHLTGEFREVDPPSRLAYTFVWEPPDPDDQETIVTLSFRDVNGSTEVNFTQGVFATMQRRALHEQGWTESFERLQELLSAP